MKKNELALKTNQAW